MATMTEAEKLKTDSDEDDEAFVRRLTFSEEYMIRHHPQNRGSYYRWFEAENVIDLVRVRRDRLQESRKIQAGHCRR
jgi:hypothetical protein